MQTDEIKTQMEMLQVELDTYVRERQEVLEKALRDSGIQSYVQETNLESAFKRGKIEALKGLLPVEEVVIDAKPDKS